MVRLFKIILHVILAATIMFPVSGKAKEMHIAQRACEEAKWDARNDVNKNMWTSMGFFFSIFGVVAANIFVPGPPVERFAGKSPEYIENYTRCYKEAMSDFQNDRALKGCFLSGAILFVIYNVYMYYPMYKLLIFDRGLFW